MCLLVYSECMKVPVPLICADLFSRNKVISVQLIGNVHWDRYLSPVPLVLIIVEDGLTVYPSHHHVVDAIAAFLPGTPWHVMVLLSSYATHG